VSTWNHCLLKAAQAECNREKVIDYARRLYIEPYYEEGDFFAILKKSVPKEQWNDFVHQLADDVLQSRNSERYAEICSSEGHPHGRRFKIVFRIFTYTPTPNHPKAS